MKFNQQKRYQRPRQGNPWTGGVHLFRIARAVWLTFRVRTLNYWSIGISCYAVRPVRDFTLHLAVISVGVKWTIAPPTSAAV